MAIAETVKNYLVQKAVTYETLTHTHSGSSHETAEASHVREEYSTFDWIMDSLLSRAGFRVLSKEITEGVIGTYLCKKE